MVGTSKFEMRSLVHGPSDEAVAINAIQTFTVLQLLAHAPTTTLSTNSRNRITA